MEDCSIKISAHTYISCKTFVPSTVICIFRVEALWNRKIEIQRCQATIGKRIPLRGCEWKPVDRSKSGPASPPSIVLSVLNTQGRTGGWRSNFQNQLLYQGWVGICDPKQAAQHPPPLNSKSVVGFQHTVLLHLGKGKQIELNKVEVGGSCGQNELTCIAMHPAICKNNTERKDRLQ